MNLQDGAPHPRKSELSIIDNTQGIASKRRSLVLLTSLARRSGVHRGLQNNYEPDLSECFDRKEALCGLFV
jgi:hypothetical protein